MGLFETSDIGIDLGTSSTLVFVKGKGIVLKEPSVVAVERVTGRIAAIGEEARKMMGREPANIVVIRPLRDGVISNFDVTARMLRYFFQKVVGTRLLYRPRAVVCIPSGVTEAEKRCVIEASDEAGARYSYLIEEPIAAAIGAGLDINEPTGHMVLDIGGGTTDIAVISHGATVISDSIKMAGDKFDDALRRYMKRKHSLYIGERNAEDIKIAYGRAHVEKEQRIIEVRGRSVVTGLPEVIPIGTKRDGRGAERTARRHHGASARTIGAYPAGAGERYCAHRHCSDRWRRAAGGLRSVCDGANQRTLPHRGRPDLLRGARHGARTRRPKEI